MSTDPIEKIHDTLSQIKVEGSKLLDKSISAVEGSDAYKYLHGLIKRGEVPTPKIFRPPPPPPPSLWQRTVDWVTDHKWIVGLTLLGVTSGGAYYIYVHPRTEPKRRARKLPNGARKEVVIIAGSPAEPLTKILATDLDKRGFIVYWTTTSPEEEAIVTREGSSYVRPLSIKVNDVNSIRDCAERMDKVLNSSLLSMPGSNPHQLSLAGVLLVPDLYFPAGPVESIRIEMWNDTLYSKLLGPIFLLSNGLIDLVRNHKSRFVILSPTIMAALNPGFHAAEALTANALSSLALALHRELSPQGIPVVHLKLGSFDVSHGRSQERQIANAVRADVLGWSEKTREIYGRAYQASAYLQTGRAYGSNLRTLNHAVFDALTTPSPARLWYVGRGSLIYQLIASTFPESALSWLLQPPVSRTPYESGWETV